MTVNSAADTELTCGTLISLIFFFFKRSKSILSNPVPALKTTFKFLALSKKSLSLKLEVSLFNFLKLKVVTERLEIISFIS